MNHSLSLVVSLFFGYRNMDFSIEQLDNDADVDVTMDVGANCEPEEE